MYQIEGIIKNACIWLSQNVWVGNSCTKYSTRYESMTINVAMNECSFQSKAIVSIYTKIYGMSMISQY